jgi:hypothetical protein
LHGYLELPARTVTSIRISTPQPKDTTAARDGLGAVPTGDMPN